MADSDQTYPRPSMFQGQGGGIVANGPALSEPYSEDPAEPVPLVEGRLVCSWPQPRLAVQTPDKLELALGEVQAGLKSHLMLVEDWYGCSREEALEIVDQIKRDEQELAQIHPEMAQAIEQRIRPVPEPGPEGNTPAQNASDSGDDDGSGYR